MGYASIADELTVNTTLGASWVEPNILYTSAASVTSGNATVNYNLGSKDVANPAAHLFTTLDFASLTVGQSIKIELSIKNNFKVGDLTDTLVFKGLQVQIENGDLADINSEKIQTNPRGTDSTTLQEFSISYDNIDAEIRKTNNNSDGTSIEIGKELTNIILTLTKKADTPDLVKANFMFKFAYTSPEVLANAALNQFANEINANNSITLDGKTDTVFNHIISEMSKNGSGSWGGNYVGNVTGDSSTDSQLINALFGDTLNNLTLDENGEPTNCTVMIKKKQVDGDDGTGENGHELVVMITPDTISGYKSTSISVYVAVFTKSNTTANSQWVQIGDVYKGTANTNNYNGGTPREPFEIFGTTISGVEANSFDTETWRSSAEYHDVAANSTIETIIAAYKELNDGADYAADLAKSAAGNTAQ